MKHAKLEQFADRINRIESRGANTFATVYTGVQDIDTPRGAKVTGVAHRKARDPDNQTTGHLLLSGLLSGCVKLAVVGAAVLLFLTFYGG